MISIELYNSGKKNEWNEFVIKSKNGTFLFLRDYMDYHAYKFKDFSLLFFENNKLVALLPLNIDKTTVYSHQGLTYGGFITDKKMTVEKMLLLFKELESFLISKCVEKLIYKAVPYIYHILPAQEDLYALFRFNASLIVRNPSSTIYQNSKINFIESRKSGIRKARSQAITIQETDRFDEFWNILHDNLQNKYGIAPVHSLDEIVLLKKLFPENIKLYLAYNNNTALAGTVIYIASNVVHVQYIAANMIGKQLGCLDLLFDHLINTVYYSIPIFDFGHSAEQGGTVLNENLVFQKEGFGGRTVTYDIYEWILGK